MNREKIDELTSKINELIHKEEKKEEKSCCNILIVVLAIVGAVAAVAGIAYAVYRYFTPDYLDDFDDEEPVVAAPKQPVKAVSTPKVSVKQDKPVRNTSSKITPMRSSRKGSQAANMEVCVIRPTSMEDTREIADTLVDNSTVVLNLEGLDMELAQRIIDFTSGACYSLGGSLQKVSSYIFILGPYNVDITGDLQNILGSNPVPSVRAGY